MPNSLADAVSPYLRSHADNPVAWQQWGAAAFVEAARRDVPVLVSIGYSTCHWCHVMARESFSDEAVAERLNGSFVAVKVDREEHPDVDASYLAAASAFTGNLGWPLTVFVTPTGQAFYAGTYYPPTPVDGHPSFSQVLDAVEDAWLNRREEVQQNAAEIRAALAAAPGTDDTETPALDAAALAGVVDLMAAFEDAEFGGFGSAPKFPVAPVQLFLARQGAGGSRVAADLSRRTLDAMASSPLRDAGDGGFFRYAVRRDWHEPHYERMLYDNALLLQAYSRLAAAGEEEQDARGDAVSGGSRRDPAVVAAGIATFLIEMLQTAEGGFGSAQDSESTVAGRRSEGGYYALDKAGRRAEVPPAVDEKVLTGWNGLAIGALAEAGARHGRDEWIAAAVRAADRILQHHVLSDGLLVRAATEHAVSTAVATLEDFGMLATGLLELALATGRVEYATEARRLVDLCLRPDGDPRVFAAPGPGDPVLAAQGTGLAGDPSEGAYPSGLSAVARAAYLLGQLTGERSYREAASRAVASVAGLALGSPIGFGAVLALASDLAAPALQVVVVTDSASRTDAPAAASARGLAAAARGIDRPGLVALVVTPEQAAAWTAAGFELLEGRALIAGRAAAYVCRDFVCRLPVTEAAALAAELDSAPGGE